MWRGARSSLPRLSFAALRPELAVATHRARPTAGPALAAALVVTRGKADGGGLFGSLRGKLEAAAEQGADLAKAKAAELEAGARKRAAELERKAGEIGAEAAAAAKAKSGVFEAEARSRAAELESKAVKMGGQAAEATQRRAGELRRRAGELENRAIDLGGQAAGAALTKAAALEAAAYRRAAELEGRAIGMGAEGMEAALSKAGRLEAYGQELARAKLNQLKDLESRATEFGTDYTDRLIQTRADVEAYGNVITEKKISQLKELEAGATAIAEQKVDAFERQRDQLLADADALNRRVGLAAAEEFAEESRAIMHMLTLELEAVRVALYSGAADPEATDAMLAEATLDLLQAAALYKAHAELVEERWAQWRSPAAGTRLSGDIRLGAELAEYIELADAVYDACAETAITANERERKKETKWEDFSTAVFGLDAGLAYSALLPPARWNAVAANSTAAPGRPAYALLLEDGGDRRAVLAIRGTASLSDVLTDMLGASTAFGAVAAADGAGPAEAHAGFVHAARGVLAGLSGSIEEHVFKGGRPLIVTGHSLGAGTAAATTVELLQQYPDRFDINTPHAPLGGQTPLSCFAYACPPVFSKAVTAGTYGYITTIVNSDDCVPRGSLHGMVGVFNEIAAQNSLAYSLELTEQALAEAHGAASGLSRGGDSAKWVVQQLEKRYKAGGDVIAEDGPVDVSGKPALVWPMPGSAPLYPAGRVVHLVRTDSPVRRRSTFPAASPREDRQYVAVEAVPELFGALQLGPEMLTDHLADDYRSAIRSAFG